MNDILTALGLLDVENNEHWTAAGLPSVEAVSALVGDTVTRKQISEALPGFDRDKARSGGTVQPPSAPTQVTTNTQPSTDDEQSQASSDEGSEIEGVEEAVEADPIALIEQAIAAASTDRYKRNYELLEFLRQFHVRQDLIKESQRRIDLRNQTRGKSGA